MNPQRPDCDRHRRRLGPRRGDRPRAGRQRRQGRRSSTSASSAPRRSRPTSAASPSSATSAAPKAARRPSPRRREALGPPRILVNCAGIAIGVKTIGKDGPHPLDLYRKVIEVNLIGTFNMIRLVADRAAKLEPLDGGERGVIVNTASVAAYRRPDRPGRLCVVQGRRRRHDACRSPATSRAPASAS